MYRIKLQKYNKGKLYFTHYGFSIKIFAKFFAMGYKAALLDTNNPEYLISIWNGKERIYNDVDVSQEIDWIAKGVSNSLYGRYVDAEYGRSLLGSEHETK